MDNQQNQDQSVQFSNLLHSPWDDLPFTPFREGITIHWLRQDYPQIALLKYEAGASVPMHHHTGLETILILSGEQTDENGTLKQGDMGLNPAGTSHSVISKTGCIALLQWEKPIKFI